MKLTKTNISIAIVIIFHAVGLVGFLMAFLRPFFLQIVPFHLLLMLFLMLYNHHGRKLKLFYFLLLMMLSGFAAEWIGVHKNWLFGSYQYGATLGSKISAIPVMISINWFLLIYSASALIQKTRIKTVFANVISGAVILVLLDLLIEPVAVKFDYWSWLNNTVPIKNYIGWFVVSTVLLTVFQLFRFRYQNWVAPVFLLVQFIFFAVLNFT